MRITKRQLRRIIKEEFNQADFPYREGDEIEIMDPTRGTTYMARVVKPLKNGVQVEEGGETFQVKYQDIVDNTGPGTKVVGGGVVREMRITKRQLSRLIREAMPAGGVPDVVGAVTGVSGEDRRVVMDYLFGLPEDELIQIAAEYLGEEPLDISYDYALDWVDGMSEEEIAEVSQEMGV